MRNKQENKTNQDQYSLKQAVHDYHKLRNNSSLPGKMQLKLDVLLKYIQKSRVSQQQLQAIPYYERQSLQAMQKHQHIDLFCNLIKCLSGKDNFVIFHDEKTYLRKEQLFQSWSQTYMTCDSKALSFKKNLNKDKIIYSFPLKETDISKGCSFYKKKPIFGFKHQGKRFILGFDTQTSCERIHKILRNIAKQKQRISKQNQLERTEANSSSTNQKIEKKMNCINALIVESQLNMSNLDQRVEELERDQEIQIIALQIHNQNLMDDVDYSLYRNFQSGRTLVNNGHKNKIKSCVLLERNVTSSLQDYLQSYAKMNQWNQNVEMIAVRRKIGQNQYIAQLRLKKYSMLAYQREAFVLMAAYKQHNKVYLYMRSQQVQDQQQSNLIVCNFRQIVELSINQTNSSFALMTVITEIDHKGYNTAQDNFNMTIQFLKSLEFFPKYYQSQTISASKKIPLFDFKYSKFRQSRKNSFATSQQDENSSKKSCLLQFESVNQMKKEMIRQQQIMVRRTSKCDQELRFGKLLTESYSGDKQSSDKLIQLMKQKTHQRYYLSKYFDQSIQIDQNRKIHDAEQMSANNYIFRKNTWKFNSDKDLVFIDEEAIKAHKDIIKYIIKQVSSNIFAGKSVMNMSLPVQIFQEKSLLQRYSQGFGFMPKFIVQAARTSNLIEQMKFVFLFYIGMAKLQTAMNKPFNPILGETFSCKIGGIPIYFEQVSHHPPISNFYVRTAQFQAYGSFDSHVEMSMNSAVGRNLKTHVWNFFKTKTSYQISGAGIEISGLMYGERKVRYVGKYMIHQKTNDVFCEVSLGKAKKKVYEANSKLQPNQIIGGIYKVSHQFGKRFRQCQLKKSFEGLKCDDIISKECTISGAWTGDVIFDGKVMMKLFDPAPNQIQMEQFALPSDSNLRSDVILKRSKQIKICQQQKQMLQDVQRKDRKLRAQKGKKY